MTHTRPKIALVTGAGKRLGQTIAVELARSGWDIAIHYGTSAKDAEQTANTVRQLGRRAITLQADLESESAVAQLVTLCQTELGLPDCIVNNASLFDYDDIQQFSYAQLDKHMRINVAAPLILARSLFSQRQALGSQFTHPGVIINLLDQKLENLNPDYLSYTLSKVALDKATILLAKSLAPTLRVVGVAPGVTMMSKDQTESGFEASTKLTPLGYSSTPQDIAQAVCFLATAHAVTGTTLYVDGGQHLKPMERDVVFLTQ